MVDANKVNKGLDREIPAGSEKGSEAGKHDQKEVKEASANVGVEAGGVVESVESEGSGEIREEESKNGEGDSGGAISKTQAQTKAATISGTLPKQPTLSEMTYQVKKELKSEIRDLNKKIKHVMRKKNLDAHKLNALVSKLRHLKGLLSKLASATADFIKDLWITHVKKA